MIRENENTPSLTKEALELLRTRELYKYYEPSTTPSLSDDEDSEQAGTDEVSGESDISSTPPSEEDEAADASRSPSDRPLSTSDPVLGSLVLTAQRLLAASRVVVILADQFREYLIADSVSAAAYYRPNDLVDTIPPRPGTWKKRCRNKGDLFSVFLQPAVANNPKSVFEIVDDELPKNDKWKKEWPTIRRYAGLPLRTRAGTIIGVLCCLHEDPREADMDEAYGKTFWKLAAAVMRYMEVVRGEREKKRGRKMEIVLSRFIAGNFSPDKVPLTGRPDGSMRVESSAQESDRIDGERMEESRERSRKELERWRGREAKRQAAAERSTATSSKGTDATDDSSVPGSTAGTSISPYDESDPVPPSAPSYFDSRVSTKNRSNSHSRESSEKPFPGKYGLPFKAPDRSPPVAPREREDGYPQQVFDPSFLSQGKKHRRLHDQQKKAHTPYFLPNGEEGQVEHPTSLPHSKRNSTTGTEGNAAVSNLPINVAAAHRALFMRAADLMHHAMEVDGVAFVNPDLEGLSDFQVPGQVSPLNHTSSDSHTSEKWRGNRSKASRSRSGILGFSGGRTASSHRGDGWGRNTNNSDHTGLDVSELSEEYLRTLTESWPRGCIFAYSKDPRHPVLGISVNRDDASDSDGPVHTSGSTASENFEVVDVLRRFLPGSKSVIFIPLYDFVGKVFAVGFAWTSSSIRIFRGDVEGGFMAAFCDSIMTEVSRLHVVSANVAKGNFISTISHELRSPLHGILASCELFRESIMDEFQRDLVGTITGCGRTLLDTVNNVLTFTKLNTRANARKDQNRFNHMKDITCSDPDVIGAVTIEDVLHSNDLVGHSSLGSDERKELERSMPEVDLAELVEEVVEASYVGYRFSPTPEQPKYGNSDGDFDLGVNNKEHVYVTLAIDPQVISNRFAVPPGAFRRLVLNLCTNALKYTDSGWVRLKLTLGDKARVTNEKGEKVKDGRLVTLVVADSGRGISREFLKNNLFTPFVQEFPMHSGTGLGMSIVRQLIEELGGTIDVSSQVDVGTEVRVELVLKTVPPAPPAHHDGPPEASLASTTLMLRGKRAIIAGFEKGATHEEFDGASDALDGLHSYLQDTLTSNFGMTLVDTSEPLHTLTSTTADVAIVLSGHTLDAYLKNYTPSAIPVIELGGGLLGGMASRASRQADSHARYISSLSRPYSPRKIAFTIEHALTRSPPQSAISSPPQSRSPPVEPQKQQITAQAPPSPAATPPDQAGPTVLIVEDNTINHRLLATFIAKRHLRSVSAYNGLEALRAVQSSPMGFDVVLMDLQMPVMSGIESTRSIRELERERPEDARCRIVALTALSGEENRVEAVRAGCDLFVVKPVKMGELGGILKEGRGISKRKTEIKEAEKSTAKEPEKKDEPEQKNEPELETARGRRLRREEERTQKSKNGEPPPN
ncbi:hypothetical protein EDC01DRAFT_635007 [Geopyxis carbonaria]|nr:hypothetical protein EDC01DRAFT_635007 [Geopyxis carbonaria]